MVAAADAATELVELRDPVALGSLDQHHRRVRHVDPDLDHAGGHEHIGLARRELGHRRGLLARGELAVHERHAMAAELGRP